MSERGKGFPRLSLHSAVKIIDAASKFGKSWPKEQFAGFGSQSGAGSARSGAFAVRLSSLKDYGLITTDKQSVTLTDLGLRIAKPVTEDERKSDIKKAFLSVETFKQLFESAEIGAELSVDQLAQSAVYTLGISRDSKERFINVFIESGKHVGLIEFDKTKSTITLLRTSGVTDDSAEVDQEDDASKEEINAQNASILTVIDPRGSKRNNTLPLNEQGINFSGEGWTLTVLLKTNLRLDSDTRKEVRELLAKADDLSEKLHGAESN